MSLFIVKAALIVGECPNPNCQRSRHGVIPGDCVAWWKEEGWDLLGWRGEKSDADAQIISANIDQMMANKRRRGAPDEDYLSGGNDVEGRDWQDQYTECDV